MYVNKRICRFTHVYIYRNCVQQPRNVSISFSLNHFIVQTREGVGYHEEERGGVLSPCDERGPSTGLTFSSALNLRSIPPLLSVLVFTVCDSGPIPGLTGPRFGERPACSLLPGCVCGEGGGI